MKSIHLLPAYGRDYSCKANVLHDWEHGKDFKMENGYYSGAYVNNAQIDQLRSDKFTHIQFRYNKFSEIFLLKI